MSASSTRYRAGAVTSPRSPRAVNWAAGSVAGLGTSRQAIARRPAVCLSHTHNSEPGLRATAAGGRAGAVAAPGAPDAVHRAGHRVARGRVAGIAQAGGATVGCIRGIGADARLHPGGAGLGAGAVGPPGCPGAIHRAGLGVARLCVVQRAHARPAPVGGRHRDGPGPGLDAAAAGGGAAEEAAPGAEHAVHRTRLGVAGQYVLGVAKARIASEHSWRLDAAVPLRGTSATGQ